MTDCLIWNFGKIIGIHITKNVFFPKNVTIFTEFSCILWIYAWKRLLKSTGCSSSHQLNSIGHYDLIFEHFFAISSRFEIFGKIFENFWESWISDAISESILYSITHLAARHELSCAAGNLDGYLKLIYRASRNGNFIILRNLTVLTLAWSEDDL